MEKREIVFLYTELATYFLACVERLMRSYPVNVHIIRWPVNAEAPFDFSFSERIRIHDRKELDEISLKELVRSISPDAIYCSGWTDKGYLSVCREFRPSGIPVIVGFDNQWKGTLKQRLAVLISPFRILSHFSHCWVPGSLQYEYAKRLGFKEQHILTGFYSCDLDFFLKVYEASEEKKKAHFPKRFIYAGRYYEFKGIRDLWSAFAELQQEEPNEWELWCLGTGDIEPLSHPRIRHFGFVQPADLPYYLEQTGVFVLPSHFEPWGVVVHEFAAAGFPVICSDETGARTAFVENGRNGYIYKAGNIPELKTRMRGIMYASDDQLRLMAEASVENAKRISPDKWAASLWKLTE